MRRNAYLAYPIDAFTMDKELVDLVNYAKAALHETGWRTFDPGDAFQVQPEPDRWISDVNFAALDGADAIFAFLPKGASTIGVPAEIERAQMTGKASVILTDNTGSYSLLAYKERGYVKDRLDEDAVWDAVGWLEERAVRDTRDSGGTPAGTSPLPFLVGDGGRLPTRGYEDDAGLDLYVVGHHVVEPGSFVDLPCRVAVEIPTWAWGLITGRSSTLRTKRLLVHSGVIDPGWRGDLFAGAMNVGDSVVAVQDGERVAQLILMPNVNREFTPVQVSSLSEHPRGTNGFGSTGR